MARRGSDGVTFDCQDCGGHADGVTVLRKRFEREAVNDLWQGARAAMARSGLPCPACSRPMAGVALRAASRASVVDACEGCLLVWFDASEIDSMPATPPPAPPARLSPVAAEAAVRLDLQRGRDATVVEVDPYSPEAMAGYVGVPTDVEEAAAGVPWITWSLGVAIVGLFLAATFAGSVEDPDGERVRRTLAWARERGFVPAAPWRHGGTTWVSTFFLHGSVRHVLANAYFLVLAGRRVEAILGRLRFAALLLLGTVAGCAAHAAARPGSHVPLVGASGAVSALFAWYAVTLPRARLGFTFASWRQSRDLSRVGWYSTLPRMFQVRVAVVWVFVAWLALQWILASIPTRVAHDAHVGGALAGLAWGAIARLRRASGAPAGP